MESFIENKKILYIDDEPEMINSFKALMRKENIQIITLQHSIEIDNLLNTEGPFSVVLSDQRMPDLDGAQVLEKVKEQSPETIRVLITGYSDYKDTIRAINLGGISSYISKPWEDEEIKRQVKDWITQYNLKKHNNYLLNLLDEENKKLSELLDGTVAQTVHILGDFACHVSPQVAELGNKVKTIGIAFLDKLPGLSVEERWEILRALDLFNLGFALLPPSLQSAIAKSGLSVSDNLQVARNHNLLAAGLIKNIPRFENVARIIELHTKDFDGSGEPKNVNLSADEIPFGARLMHILIDIINPPSGKLRGFELLQHMESMPKKYDVRIIKQILGKNLQTNFTVEEKFLRVNELQAGMVILKEVRSISGELLLKANVTLTETFIVILHQWHVRDPLVEPINVRCIL
jgi:response regulator RpfG family c-di-GMP phosphodiesterase